MNYTSNVDGSFGGNMSFTSNMHVTASNLLFTSSDDITRLLANHPDFLRLPPSAAQAIIAAIISGLALLGSVILTFVTAGAASPLIVAVVTVVAAGSAAGLQYAITGAVTGHFSWATWLQEIGISAGIALVTFGAGFGTGRAVGGMLAGVLADSTVNTIGVTLGALVGAGVQEAGILLRGHIEGTPVGVMTIVLSGLTGALAGSAAASIGVQVALDAHLPPPSMANPRGHADIHVNGNAPFARMQGNANAPVHSMFRDAEQQMRLLGRFMRDDGLRAAFRNFIRHPVAGVNRLTFQVAIDTRRVIEDGLQLINGVMQRGSIAAVTGVIQRGSEGMYFVTFFPVIIP